MGDFIGQIRGQGQYQTPEELQHHIQVRTTVEFNEQDGLLLTIALHSLNSEIKEVGRDYSLVPHGVILLNDDENFSYVSSDTLGYTLPMIVIVLGKAKRNNLSDLIVLTMYLEEFFHHFLMIHDEEEVKNRVVARLNKTLNFRVEFHDVYAEDWKSGYPDIYGDDN